MQKLLEALTELATEATIYYRTQNQAALPCSNPKCCRPAEAAPAPAAAPTSLAADVGPAAKPKKEPKKKAAVAPEAPAAPAAAPAAAPVVNHGLGIADAPAPAAAPTAPTMTEAESLAEVYKAGAAYIQRTPEPEKMIARQTYAKAYMAEHFKVENLKDIPHAGRVAFIDWLKAAPTEPALKTVAAA